MPQSRHRRVRRSNSRRQSSRSLRTFLLAVQFEAKEIGERIAQARREAGLTQEQLAEIASFSKRSLQDYEAGTTIPYRHLRELSRLLKRDVDWFLHGASPAGNDRIAELEGQLEAEVARLRQLGDGLEAELEHLQQTRRKRAP